MFHLLFRVNMLFLAVSGLGHMPIFKRYYIADIPGLGWLAEFHITLALHYLTAAIFLCMAGWVVTEMVMDSARSPLALGQKIKAGVYTLIILSGALLVVKNMLGVYLPAMLITATDLVHLTGAMTLGITAMVLRPKKHTLEEASGGKVGAP